MNSVNLFCRDKGYYFQQYSVISWWSVLLVEETRVLGENHRPVTSHSQKYLEELILLVSYKPM